MASRLLFSVTVHVPVDQGLISDSGCEVDSELSRGEMEKCVDNVEATFNSFVERHPSSLLPQQVLIKFYKKLQHRFINIRHCIGKENTSKVLSPHALVTYEVI